MTASADTKPENPAGQTTATSTADTATGADDKANELEQRVKELFRDTCLVGSNNSSKKHKIRVETAWSGSVMTTLSVGYADRLEPDDFKHILTDFADAFPKINPMCKSVTVLADASTSTSSSSSSSLTLPSTSREAIRLHLKFPFPLTDRVMYHWKYLRLNRRDTDEHMLLFSEDGNDELLEKHYRDSDDEATKVLARTFLCAYWILPVYNKDGGERTVVGSEIRYCFSGDTGGSIPSVIQNAVGPKTASDSVKGLIALAKKMDGARGATRASA